MFFILKMFANSGIVPKVIQAHQDIKYIQVKSFNLKFINIINFFKLEYNAYFFPTTLINERAVGMNIIPNLQDYITILDTSDIIEAKTNFYNEINFSEWNFYNELSAYLMKKTLYLIDQCAVYLAECFNFQKIGFEFFTKPLIKRKLVYL